MASRRHRLAQRRKAVGYTQEQLAEQLGVERTTVIRWEAGDTQPQPWQWPNLADALKITVEQLTDLLDGTPGSKGGNAHQALPLLTDVPATLTGDVALSGQTETLLLDFFAQPAITEGISPTLLTPTNVAALGRQIKEIDLTEMAQVIVMWATRLNSNISRRELLSKLSAAFALAGAAPLFHTPDTDERTQVRAVMAEPTRFSEPVLRYCETALDTLRRQGDVLGPQAALQSTLDHRQLAIRQAKAAPPHYRSRALSVAAELNQLVGWFCFNLGDYRGAQHYYDEARSAAHDAHNVELVTYVLCTMSHLATWQHKPRVGIDHAIAAQAWAGQTGNPTAAAYAADVAARAFAADQETDRCRAALDAEQTALATAGQGESGLPLWYFYDESFYWATKSDCALQLDDPATALESVTTSLGLIDPANVHNYAFTMLIRAEAYLQQGDVTGASGIIGDVATVAAVNSSRRIDQKITDLRTALTPWQRRKPVRQLDEVLRAHRLGVVGKGSGNT
jgi:DNA-binding XRE family transcriptional regulator